MAPVTQYVFAEMLGISEHFTAGSHEWLPYSVIPIFPKLICKQQFPCLMHFPQSDIEAIPVTIFPLADFFKNDIMGVSPGAIRNQKRRMNYG